MTKRRLRSVGARCAVLAVLLSVAGTAAARDSGVFLVAPERAAGDRFGAALDAAGTTMVVGAPGRGAVHVFVQIEGSWTHATTFTAPDATAGDEFGAAVGLDGDTLVVGAPGRAGGSGAAYVFTRSGDAWTPGPVLVPDGAAPGWRAGTAVDVAGDLAVVGAPGANGEAGLAAAFAGAAWAPLGAVVDPAALIAGDRTGASVATDGATVVVGAPRRDGDAGADTGVVFVAHRAGGAIVELASRSPRANDRFGAGVDVRGDALAVGVPSGSIMEGSSTITAPGSVQLFGLVGGAWTPTARVSAFGPGNTRGESVRLGGTRVVSGAPFSEGEVGILGESAALYVAFRNGATWIDGGEPLRADVEEADWIASGLGTSVGLTSDTIAGGAPFLDEARGRVYLFQSNAPVFDVPPTATPSTPSLLEPVQLTGHAVDPDGDEVSYVWSFGDGAATSVTPTSHRYAGVGSFEATLLASDGIAEASASVRVDVPPPTSTVTRLEFREKYKEALVPVGGGEEEGSENGGERDVAASGIVRLKGTLALAPADVAALGPASRFRFGLGDAAIDVALGDDPSYAAGATTASIVVATAGDDDAPAFRWLALELDWAGGALAFRVKVVPAKGFRLFADPVVGAALAGTPSGKRTGVVEGAVVFGPASATVRRSYKARVKTVSREPPIGRAVYRSVVKVKAKGAL